MSSFLSTLLQVIQDATGDCQFSALLPTVSTMKTTDGQHEAQNVSELRILSAEYLRSHASDPCSYDSGTKTYSTWGADILASVSGTSFWSRYKKLDFDTYCDALLIPGSELLVLLICLSCLSHAVT
jgi:hypothetical protein